jgi:plasmid stabilization system protein ParE
LRKSYILSPEAIDDLSEIWQYVSTQSGASIADEIEEDIFKTLDLLEQFPKAGHPRIDLTSRPVLFFPVQKYMIVYQDTPERIFIHAVLHSARNLRRILKERTG